MYSFHLFLMSFLSTKSPMFLSLIAPIFGQNVPLIFPIFLKRSLDFPLLLFSSIFMHCSLKKAFLSLLAILWNSAFSWMYLSLSLYVYVCVCKYIIYESESHSVVSDSLRPHGLYSPWNSPGQNIGVGRLFLSRWSSQFRNQTQVSLIAGRFFTSWAQGIVCVCVCVCVYRNMYISVYIYIRNRSSSMYFSILYHNSLATFLSLTVLSLHRCCHLIHRLFILDLWLWMLW